MEQTESYSQIKQKTILSTVSLFFQSGYSAFLGLAANLAVTVLLSPEIFGIYITTLSIISVLNYFSDIGLAASLVQKKELHHDDVKTTFTIQQLMIVTAVSVGFLTTNLVRNFYKLPHDGIHLYWALLLSFFISSLKTIPSIFLERKIKFQRVVLVQIVENTVFYICVIVLAILGHELRSFTIAVILRAFTGLILIYILSPWTPKLGISKVSLKTLLSFGLPFQASSFLALFKDDLIILFLGKILGFEALGYIGWAKKWAEAPIRIIMDNISRVLFPVISRIQHDTAKIGRVLDKILYYQTMVLAPTLFGAVILMGTVIEVIPKYNKWSPALPLFYIFCLASFFSSYSSPFMNFFNALGKVKISFTFMLLWTVATWLLTPIMTLWHGYFGFPITLLIVASSSVFVSYRARSFVTFHIYRSVYKSMLSSLFMATVMLILVALIQNPYVRLPTVMLTGIVVYFFALLFAFKVNLIKELQTLFVK
ncbi:MAG: oligosaccharide flippase family protein [Patescibacteria group bacterium]